MNARTARWLAWFSVGLYFVLATVGLALQFVTGRPVEHVPGGFAVLAFFGVGSGIWAVIGALIVSRHPRHPIGWLLCAMAIDSGMQNFSFGYAAYGLVAYPGSLPGAEFMVVWTAISYSAAIFIVLLILLLLLFPAGRPLTPRWRLVAWLAIGTGTFGVVLAAVKPGPVEDLPPFITNPIGVSPSMWAMLEPLFYTAFIVATLCLLAAAVSLVLRLRRARGDERQQVKWFAYSAAFFPIAMLLFAAEEVGWIWFSLGWAYAAYGLGYVTLVGLPIATAIAIFKYRLYDIDLLINRTLVYGTLMAFVIGIYILIVGAFGTFFQAQGNLLIALLATGLVAVLFQPLRERLQHSVNRLIFGERDDPIEAMSRLGKRLESSLVPEAVLPSLVETIAHTLKLPYVAITLPGEAGERVTASHGHPAHDAIRFPLTFQGQTTGQLVLAPRHPDTSFSSAEMRLLRNVARQAGAAVHAVRLTNDLLRSRQRLVTAREEERRRLRRDLHDGLGPTLAALHVQASALRRLIHTDPEAAEMMVAEFDDEIREAIDDIRRVVYKLRPPTLDDLGLVGAARAYAAHCSRQVYQQANQDPYQYHDEGTLSIHVEAPGEMPLLPAAVEVAAYHVIREALTNIVHHAQARQCVVRFQVKEALVVEIVDDGIGLPVDHQVGVGLLSMRERAEELGGRFVIEPDPGGGTRVRAQFPLLEV